MHILYIFPEELPIKKARAIQVIKTVAALATLHQQVTLAYVPVPDTDPFAYYGVAKPENVQLLPLSRSLPFLPKLRSGVLFFFRFRQWLRQTLVRQSQNKPDLIFVRHIKFAHRLLNTDTTLPVVYEAHEVFADAASGIKATKLAAIEKHVLEKSQLVIAITRQLADILQKRYQLGRTIHLLPSATDLPEQPPCKTWGKAAQQISYTGSLYGWKGVNDLIQAAGLLPETVTLTIVGGDQAAIMRLQQQQPKHGAKVIYRGHLSHQETLAILAETCIAILPNRAGSVSMFTSPLKLFEYMAMGCVLVASDLPVFHEVLANDEAFWFEAGNVQGLAKALMDALAASENLPALAATMTSKAKDYSWHGRATQLIALLSNHLHKP